MCRFRLSALYCVRIYTRLQAGVDAVRKRDIDDAVMPAKGNGGLGAVPRQGKQTFSCTARK
jgi:hypothetical protein